MFYYVAACVHGGIVFTEVCSWCNCHNLEFCLGLGRCIETNMVQQQLIALSLHRKKTKENPYSNICFYFFNLKLTKHQTSELALNLQFGTLNHYWDTFSSHGYWIKINHVWKQDFPHSCNHAHLWILYFFKVDFSFPGSHDGWHLRNSFYSMKSRAVQSRLYWNLHLMERVSLLSASLPI